MNATSPAGGLGVSWRLGLFVFLSVVLLSVPQVAMLPLIDRDEPHFAEASREMLQSGNFIVPTFNHEPRYNKPPLIYWCQTLCYTIFGENAFAARLPSVLATAGTAVVLLAWGTRVGSEPIGLGAGLAYAFCLQTMQQGRVATADGLLIFFMTLTTYAGWRVITTEHVSHGTRSYFWDTILTLGFAGGFLAKGPEAFLPLLPMLVCARGIRKQLWMELAVNFLIGAVIVLFWAIPAYVQTHGDYWRVGMSEGVGERMVTNLQGHGASTLGWYLLSIPLYLILFWVSALPWSPVLIIQRKKLFTAWTWDRLDTYLILHIGLVFLIFSLMVTKLPHYTLPAFPLIALLLAKRWKAVGLSPDVLTKLGWITGIVGAFLTLVLVPIALVNHSTPSPVGELVRDAQATGTIHPQTEFATVDFVEPNAIWEMRRVVGGYGRGIDEAKVISFLNEPGPRAVVLSTALWQKLQGQGNVDAAWKTYEARGFNAGRGKFVDLTLVVKS